MNHISVNRPGLRRGAVAVFTAFMMVFIMGMVAFAIDLGYIAVVRNRLQVAADAAALAGAANIGDNTKAVQAAKNVAALNVAGSPTDMVSLADSDIVFGNWNSGTKTFTANGTPSNACRVVARRPALPLFFAPVLGIRTIDVQAAGETTAVVNPRDIVFVLDLSGSMNNDTEIWATASINGAYPDYPTVGTDSMQNVFTDFGYGTYPGTVQYVGQGYLTTAQLGTSGNSAYNSLTNTTNGFLLNNSTYGTTYKISSTDSAATRKTKAYSFIIDKQLATIMPQANPPLNSSTNLNYWSAYLDYVFQNQTVTIPSQNSNTMSTLSNPYPDAWPSLTSSSISPFYNKVGYQTYVQFMMDMGRNLTPNGTTVTPMSTASSYCPKRTETDTTSAGYGFSFPPREQPTHAMRVAVMAAVDKIAKMNTGITGTLKDHVAIVTFDTIAGSVTHVPLSATDCDYTAVKTALCNLQAVGDDQLSTGSEKGLQMAYNLLDPAQNTNTRASAVKMVVFLSDGIANLKVSSNTTITNYTSANSSAAEWFDSTDNYYLERNGALMQTNLLKSKGYATYAVGIGLGCDRSLMDRIVRVSGTGITDPNNTSGPKISPYAQGNPADYQSRLTSIFNDIIKGPNVTLVK
jgi:Flp pilus assembly protein TadG